MNLARVSVAPTMARLSPSIQQQAMFSSQGRSGSVDFPGTAGGAQPASAGGSFVARFNASLTTLIQATYLGGTGAHSLAIEPTSGDVYVAGRTASNDFPHTTGGAQPASGGFFDIFVARLSSDLAALIQATYFGGSGGEEVPALAIHPTTGDVFVTASTWSTDLPGTANGAQPAFGGGAFDAFIARFNSTLTILNQATYLGGSGIDYSSAVAIDPLSGEVFVGGETLSADFPGTIGGAQPSLSGRVDAFVARFDETLATLTQATYLGGSGEQELPRWQLIQLQVTYSWPAQQVPIFPARPAAPSL